MKKIIIGRHAKSDWSLGMPDIDRPLNNRGKKDAPAMGKLLAGYGFKPDLILSSPANRARSTAELIGQNLGYKSPIRIESAIYEGGPVQIIRLLQQLPEEAESVMLFGHNPTQEEVVRQLLGMSSDIVMPTCALVCMEASASSWSGLALGRLNLKWFLIPRLIRGEKQE